MKWKNKIFLILGLSVFSLQHCTEGFEDINIDPTQANTIDPAFQLTRVQLTMTNNNYEHWRAQFIYTSCFVQHNASSFSYWSGDKYNRIDEYSAAQWDSDFPRGVKNIVDMINRTQGDPNFVNFNAAGRILRVYLFHRLTDLYGDLPYSEAGRGFIDNIYFPRYDPQQEIYNDFFRELTEASQAFNPSALPLRGDFWFNRQMETLRRLPASAPGHAPGESGPGARPARSAGGHRRRGNARLRRLLHRSPYHTRAQWQQRRHVPGR
jgi:hypothetical protein